MHLISLTALTSLVLSAKRLKRNQTHRKESVGTVMEGTEENVLSSLKALCVLKRLIKWRIIPRGWVQRWYIYHLIPLYKGGDVEKMSTCWWSGGLTSCNHDTFWNNGTILPVGTKLMVDLPHFGGRWATSHATVLSFRHPHIRKKVFLHCTPLHLLLP